MLEKHTQERARRAAMKTGLGPEIGMGGQVHEPGSTGFEGTVRDMLFTKDGKHRKSDELRRIVALTEVLGPPVSRRDSVRAW